MSTGRDWLRLPNAARPEPRANVMLVCPRKAADGASRRRCLPNVRRHWSVVLSVLNRPLPVTHETGSLSPQPVIGASPARSTADSGVSIAQTVELRRSIVA